MLRGIGEPFTVQADGPVANQIRVKIANRGRTDRRYRIALGGAAEARCHRAHQPAPGRGRGTCGTTSLFVILPRAAFHDGEHAVTFTVRDGAGSSGQLPYRLVGPEEATAPIDARARCQPAALAHRHRVVLAVTVVANGVLLWRRASPAPPWSSRTTIGRRVAWDSTMAEAARSAALGWTLDSRLVPEPDGRAPHRGATDRSRGPAARRGAGARRGDPQPGRRAHPVDATLAATEAAYAGTVPLAHPASGSSASWHAPANASASRCAGKGPGDG